jgi:hypothetical protein
MTTHYLHNATTQIAFAPTEDGAMEIIGMDLKTSKTWSEKESVEGARHYYAQLRADGFHKGMANQSVNIQPILDKLNHALGHGVKSPKMIVEGFCFKLAKPQSKNPGCVYVTESAEYGSTYFGKIDPKGRFHAAYDAPADTEARLASIAADVVAAAKAYGRMTGRCSFCARELTNSVSIALSYGPICAERYGLPHNYEDRTILLNAPEAA